MACFHYVSESLVTPDILADYLAGDRVKEAKELLQNKGPNGIREHARCRNFLMISLAMRNSQRPGPITNMTIKEFEGRIIVDGNYVVKVNYYKLLGLQIY